MPSHRVLPCLTVRVLGVGRGMSCGAYSSKPIPKSSCSGLSAPRQVLRCMSLTYPPVLVARTCGWGWQAYARGCECHIFCGAWQDSRASASSRPPRPCPASLTLVRQALTRALPPWWRIPICRASFGPSSQAGGSGTSTLRPTRPASIGPLHIRACAHAPCVSEQHAHDSIAT